MPTNYLLELDGKLAGRIFGVEGGVVKQAFTLDSGAPKTLKYVDIEPLDLSCGTGMSHAFYDWIGQTFGRTQKRMSGAVIAMDQHLKPVFRQEFYDALILEVVLPSLDKSQKKEAAMQVKIKPEAVKIEPLQGGKALNLGVYRSRTAKTWLVNNFRFQIVGMLRECQQLTRMGSIRLTQGVKGLRSGNERLVQLEATNIVFPNIAIELPVIYGDGFMKWYTDSANSNGSSHTKKGSIDFLAPASSTSYFGLDVSGLGIVSVTRISGQPLKVEMYCERMSFRAGGAAIK